MVEYECVLCSYKTIIKTQYDKHMKTKKHLANEKIHKTEKKIIESKMNPIESKLNPIESTKKFECLYCHKFYSTNSNLHKHIKKCPMKNIYHNFSESKLNPIESKNDPKMTPNDPKMTQMTQNDPK